MIPYHVQLNQIISEAASSMKAIHEKAFNFKAHETKWSKKEILGHLIDSAYNNHQRFLRACHQADLVFQGYDQTEWVKLNNYQEREKGEVLNTWVTVNQHLSKLIENISQEILERKTENHNFHKICMNLLKEGEPTNLAYLIWDYLFHLEHHLGQIIPAYEKRLRLFHYTD